MAKIKAFKAVRPAQELAEKIAALPYDVYNREEAAEKVKGDNYSFLRIDRPETQFSPDADMYAPEVYAKASEMLDEMEKKGEFVQDQTECLYIYELTMDGRTQTGLVACSSVDDYINDVVKKHENTRKEKEADRIRHVDICSAQTGPIFLAYRGRRVINDIIRAYKENTPAADFTSDDGITHRVWVIDDPDVIKLLIIEFDKLPHTYIADGHHRAASAVAVSKMRREKYPEYTGEEEFNYFLSVLFPEDELKIMDYNRVLKTMNGHTHEELLELIGEKFEIEESAGIYAPKEKGEVGFLLGNKWYALKARKEFVKDDPVEALDVAFLQREILTPVFGIDDPTRSNDIDFVGGIRGLGELERRCQEDCAAAFAMFPTDIRELFAVADADMLMPPKSTWFEPKLRSGLFIHRIER